MRTKIFLNETIPNSYTKYQNLESRTEKIRGKHTHLNHDPVEID